MRYPFPRSLALLAIASLMFAGIPVGLAADDPPATDSQNAPAANPDPAQSPTAPADIPAAPSDGADPATTDGADASAALPIVVLLPLNAQNPFADHGCWLQVFEDKNFVGKSLVVEGPRDLANLDAIDKHRYFETPGHSLIVGPTAAITLYEQRDYQGRSVAAAAAERVEDIAARFGQFDGMDSLKVQCTGETLRPAAQDQDAPIVK